MRVANLGAGTTSRMLLADLRPVGGIDDMAA